MACFDVILRVLYTSFRAFLEKPQSLKFAVLLRGKSFLGFRLALDAGVQRLGL